MRTTLTIDDSINQDLRELAARRNETFREAVDAALRAGLKVIREDRDKVAPFVVEPNQGGFRPGIDPEKLNQLVDECDVADFEQESRL